MLSVKFFSISALLMILNIPLTAQEVITLAHPELPGKPNRETQKLIDLYGEAFSELGYKLEIAFFPAKRCLYEADSGEADGMFLSEEGTANRYTNLVRIDVPIRTLVYSAYAKKQGISLNGWESLEGVSHTVCYENGVVPCEVNIPRFVPPEQIVKTSGTEKGLRMVMAERCDIFIDLKDRVTRTLDRNKDLKDVIYSAGIMGNQEMYLYLNKEHLGMTEELTRILKRMKYQKRFD